MNISDLQVKAAEEIASQVYDKQLSAKEGAKILIEYHGLNPATSMDFINDYKCMMQGKLFQRAMSASATSYFLSRIQTQRGDKCLAVAISSVDQHINYYEQLRNYTMHSMREVVNAFRISAAPIDLEQHNIAFNAAIAESFHDTSAARHARLRSTPKLPLKITVITYAYIRSADVVTEVLIRAKGICEHCKKPAPFKRKSNSVPYLEVHHVVQLANGGEDTVSNALALCPNCHRFLHFGVTDDTSYAMKI